MKAEEITARREMCRDMIGATAEEIVQEYVSPHMTDGRVYFYDAVHAVEATVTKLATYIAELEREVARLRKELESEKGLWEKLHAIEEAKIIYDIHYCRAGVGFKFYEPPADAPKDQYPENWKDYLNIYKYYDCFEQAITEEYKKLSHEKQQALTAKEEK